MFILIFFFFKSLLLVGWYGRGFYKKEHSVISSLIHQNEKKKIVTND